MKLNGIFKFLLTMIFFFLNGCFGGISSPVSGSGYTAGNGDYTVYFDAQGGTADYYSIRANYGDRIILPNASKSGYGFYGWYDSYGYLVGASGSPYTVTSSINLHAEWNYGAHIETGTLLIQNTSNYDISVYIDGNYTAEISSGYQRKISSLTQGYYDIRISDYYGGNNFKRVYITAGYTETIKYDGYSLY